MVRLRVESYAGMIFASFNHDIEPLTDFLGPAMKWMDLFMKQGLATRCRPPPRTVFAFPATGKIQLEKYHRRLSLPDRS